MSQLALFETGPRVLLDDATGLITYWPSVIDRACAADWFAQLRAGVPWQHERRMMFDREVAVPRLTAAFGLGGSDLPQSLRPASSLVCKAAGVAFNSVGLNYYRDQNDSLAPHNDHLYELVPGMPIALLSLGATRDMVIRAKRPPRRSLHVDLESGSLLVMSYDTQRHYDHGVPKSKMPVGERISLAFRVKTEEPGPDEGSV